MKPPIQQNAEPPVNKPSPRRPDPSRVNNWLMIQTALSVAIVAASLFTIWTPAALFNNPLSDRFTQPFQNGKQTSSAQMTPTPQPSLHIGIISGHWGSDSGAVCSDGLTESDVNLNIATLVKQDLTAQGYTVDLLQENDKRLNQYQGLVVVSIHNDSCEYINDSATGFKVAASVNADLHPERVNRLTACLTDRYANTTGLKFHEGSVTPEMTDYHVFKEINGNTPAAIIEAGFLNLDRDILTKHPDTIANGITEGILCYIRNESISTVPTIEATSTGVPVITSTPTSGTTTAQP